MSPKNNAKYVAAFRARQREKRIVRVELYAHADDVSAILEYAEKLKEVRSDNTTTNRTAHS